MLVRPLPSLALLVPVLALSVLAGCVASADPAIVETTSDAVGPTDASGASGPGGVTEAAAARARGPASGADVRAIPVTGTYHDYGTGLGWPTCTTPPECAIHIPFGVRFTGTLEGDAEGQAHGNLSEPQSPDRIFPFYKDPFTFSGTIAGCGSGTLNFFVNGYFALDAEGLRTNETLRLTPGSTTTGFAGVVDAVVYMDTHEWPGISPITGTVWCR